MKKNQRIATLLALFGLFLAFASGDGAARSNVAAPSPSVQQDVGAPQRGTLFRVRSKTGTAYLFGTLHVGQSSFYPLGPQVSNALAVAGTLVVEFDIRNQKDILAATMKYGLYPVGDTIDKHLSSATLDRLHQVLQQLMIPFSRVQGMKPWMVANLLLSATLEQNGFQTRQGVDLFLLEQASAQRKVVHALESANYQMSLFDGMSEKDQESYLVENLDEIQSGRLLEKTRAMAKAWVEANTPAFLAMMQEELSASTQTADFFQRVMLDKRNPEMAAQIEGLLQRRQTIFVGVGMLHLIGEKGIPDMLRRRGYVVEKLY